MTPNTASQSETDIDVSGISIFSDDYVVIVKNFLAFAAISLTILIGFSILYRTINLNLYYKVLFIFAFLFTTFTFSVYIYLIFRKSRSVTLSPEGLKDSSIMTEFVPWSAVNTVSPSWSCFNGIKLPISIHLGLKPGRDKILKLNWRGEHLFLKKDELHIAFGNGMTSLGIGVDLERFSQVVKAYARAYGDGVR